MRGHSFVRTVMMAALLAAATACGTLAPRTTTPGAAGAPAPSAILPSTAGQAAPPAQIGAPAPPAAPAPAAPRPVTRIALLLPLHSGALGTAARAIRDGFMAAYERDADNVLVTAFDTGEDPDEVLRTYLLAQQEADIVVGPLQRQSVAAVAQSGQVGKPTLALNQPEAGESGDRSDSVLPPAMLAMGLSAEDEARQLARWSSSAQPDTSAYAVFGQAGWQRRAARAFAAQRLNLGLPTKMAEVSGEAGDARLGDIVKLQMRLQAEPAGSAPLLFVALDFDGARALHAALGARLQLYGTSQLNPNVAGNPAEPAADMDGVRLLELPWQVQADEAAVMLYPRPLTAPDFKPDPDLARLYALGIDAFRVAYTIAHDGRREFTLDGVTGRLAVHLDGDGPRFERTEVPAQYRDGVVHPAP